MAGKKTKAAQANSVPAQKGKSEARQLAEAAISPAAQSLLAVQQFAQHGFGELETAAMFGAISAQTKASVNGDLANARAMLAGQAIALNTIFTEMARRAGNNMGEYLNATQLYMRLALKAQAQCRSTIEALERLTNGHVQTVKHVHVNEGGQAVIADEFHHHTGGSGNGQCDEQPHATGSTSGTAGQGPALSGPDPFGQGVPIASGERQETVQDARG